MAYYFWFATVCLKPLFVLSISPVVQEIWAYGVWLLGQTIAWFPLPNPQFPHPHTNTHTSKIIRRRTSISMSWLHPHIQWTCRFPAPTLQWNASTALPIYFCCQWRENPVHWTKNGLIFIMKLHFCSQCHRQSCIWSVYCCSLSFSEYVICVHMLVSIKKNWQYCPHFRYIF